MSKADIWITWHVEHTEDGYRWTVGAWSGGIKHGVTGGTVTRLGANWVILRHVLRLRNEAQATAPD